MDMEISWRQYFRGGFSMVNVVAIPTRDRFDLLAPLIAALLEDDAVSCVFVMDNGLPDSDRASLKTWAKDEPRLSVGDQAGKSIYEMWNAAWKVARFGIEADTLTLLNDDVKIPKGFIGYLRNRLDSDLTLWAVCPDYKRSLVEGVGSGSIRYVEGTYKNGGMSGFAFMFLVKDFSAPPFDERFRWWGGDDRFAADIIERGGRIGYVEGLPIEHQEGATSCLHPEIEAMIEQDIKLMRAEGLM